MTGVMAMKPVVLSHSAVLIIFVLASLAAINPGQSRNWRFFMKGLQNGRQRSQAARLACPANSAADLFWTIGTRGRSLSLTYG
jgi:hypothetical protein